MIISDTVHRGVSRDCNSMILISSALQVPVDAIPSDIGLQGTLEMLPNWQKYAISLGLSMEQVEYYARLQEMNMGGLQALKHWRDGKCGSNFPSTWKFLISVIDDRIGCNVAKDLKAKVTANKLWTCTSQAGGFSYSSWSKSM